MANTPKELATNPFLSFALGIEEGMVLIIVECLDKVD